MTTRRAILAAALALPFAPAAATAGSVSVTFVNPERYRDRDLRLEWQRDGVLKDFELFFAQLGERYLKPGQSLGIEVLDIGLAGDYEPWRFRLHDVRIMSQTTPPRFKLRYALSQKGRVLLRGEETVSDLNYLMNGAARVSGRRFAYEKQMLEFWFRDRFVSMPPQS